MLLFLPGHSSHFHVDQYYVCVRVVISYNCTFLAAFFSCLLIFVFVCSVYCCWYYWLKVLTYHVMYVYAHVWNRSTSDGDGNDGFNSQSAVAIIATAMIFIHCLLFIFNSNHLPRIAYTIHCILFLYKVLLYLLLVIFWSDSNFFMLLVIVLCPKMFKLRVQNNNWTVTWQLLILSLFNISVTKKRIKDE